MKKALSLVLALALALCLGGPALAAGSHTVTIINGMDGSVAETFTVADGEDLVFSISCAAPADMGPVNAGELGSGVTTDVGKITYSNVTTGGPNAYPTAETVTISGITRDAKVTVTPNPAEVDGKFPAITEGELAGSGEASGNASGEASGAAGSVAPGEYTDGVNTLIINDDLTFTCQSTGQNMEGADFVLTISGTVTADGAVTITGLTDGAVELIEMATEEQLAKDTATVEALVALAMTAPASGEPSGEASAAPAGGDMKAAYTEYLHQWLLAELAVNSNMTLEQVEDEFMPLIEKGDYVSFPAEMLWNNMLNNGCPMTYDEFVAAGGVY